MRDVLDWWPNIRVYPSDLLGFSPMELYSLCVPFLLFASVLWLYRCLRKR